MIANPIILMYWQASSSMTGSACGIIIRKTKGELKKATQMKGYATRQTTKVRIAYIDASFGFDEPLAWFARVSSALVKPRLNGAKHALASDDGLLSGALCIIRGTVLGKTLDQHDAETRDV